MIHIDDRRAYDVLNEGDGVQVIHECKGKVLIGFTDPDTGKDTLAWVDSEYVVIHQKATQDVAHAPRQQYIKLAYSSERGIINDAATEPHGGADTQKGREKWSTTRKRSPSRWLRVAWLLVAVALLLIL